MPRFAPASTLPHATGVDHNGAHSSPREESSADSGGVVIATGSCGSILLTNNGTRVKKIICTQDLTKIAREKQIFSRCLSHPNVIQYTYYKADAANKRVIIEMMCMNLGSLKRVMQKRNFSVEQRFAMARLVGLQVLLGLNYFHQFERRMHRDIKPGNILLNSEGRVKLCDFDTSVETDQVRDTVIGTTCYAAPEVIQKAQGHSSKCDVWSFGVVLYEIATGKHPYMLDSNAGGFGAFFDAFRREPNLSLLNQDKCLQQIVARCLTVDPEQRPSCQELLNDEFFLLMMDSPQDANAMKEMQNHGIVVEGNEKELESYRLCLEQLQDNTTAQNRIRDVMKRLMYEREKTAIKELRKIVEGVQTLAEEFLPNSHDLPAANGSLNNRENKAGPARADPRVQSNNHNKGSPVTPTDPLSTSGVPPAMKSAQPAMTRSSTA